MVLTVLSGPRPRQTWFAPACRWDRLSRERERGQSGFYRAAAGAGFCVLTGQCVELGAEGLPLAPLVDALRTLARTMPPDVLAGVLGPAAPGLSRLLPELAALTAHGGSGGAHGAPSSPAAPAGEDMQKAQLLELVLGTLGRLSSVAPVLFTVEDVHWADRSTLDLTAFLIRSLRNARVLVVVTYRSDELHRRHPLRPLLTSWERDRSIDRIELRRFRQGRGGRPAARDPRRGARAGRHRHGLRPLRGQRLPGRGAGRDGQDAWRPGGPAAITGGRAAQPGGRAHPRRAEAAAHRLGGGPGRAGPAARRGRGAGRERAVRRVARGRGEPPARGRSRRAGLCLPPRADQGRRLRGHAAR
jgi:hypothetical protein